MVTTMPSREPINKVEKDAKGVINIYAFTDYREYLRKMMDQLKTENPHFSFRYFNRLAGISSSGFLQNVLEGRRNLAGEGIRKIIRGLKLEFDEGHYFETLVNFNQAETHEERDQFFQELMRYRGARHAQPLTEAQYNLFSRWYYVAILEAVRIRSRSPKNAEWLALRLRPVVKKSQVEQAVKDLSALGLLTVDESGVIERTEAMLSTPDIVQSVALANFHSQMNHLAARALVEQENQDREFSSLTVCLSDTGFEAAKAELRRFRKKLHTLLEEDSRAARTQVAQVNLQIFKLTTGGVE